MKRVLRQSIKASSDVISDENWKVFEDTLRCWVNYELNEGYIDVSPEDVVDPNYQYNEDDYWDFITELEDDLMKKFEKATNSGSFYNCIANGEVLDQYKFKDFSRNDLAKIFGTIDDELVHLYPDPEYQDFEWNE